jgi:hypothetical protein
MTHDLTLEGQVQLMLNEMWLEGLVPFQLNVGKITKEPDEYHIYFYHSRIHMAVVPLVNGYSLDDLVRSAVLARVENISGPLTATH